MSSPVAPPAALPPARPPTHEAMLSPQSTRSYRRLARFMAATSATFLSYSFWLYGRCGWCILTHDGSPPRLALN